jgi:hypothetical protein
MDGVDLEVGQQGADVGDGAAESGVRHGGLPGDDGSECSDNRYTVNSQ